MTDREYEQLEKRIAERDRIKAMNEDLAKSKKETSSAHKSELARNPISITRAYSGGGPPKLAKLSGDSFSRIQIRNGES